MVCPEEKSISNMKLRDWNDGSAVKALATLPEDLVPFPAPTSNGSQSPVTPRDLLTSDGL